MEKVGQDRGHCTNFCSSELFELSGSLHTLVSCSPLRLVPARGTSFLCFAKERKQRKATAGTGLALPNFPHSAQFFGRARNLRLRRFGHASPYSPKNRAPFGCASRRVVSSLKKQWLFCWHCELTHSDTALTHLVSMYWFGYRWTNSDKISAAMPTYNKYDMQRLPETFR